MKVPDCGLRPRPGLCPCRRGERPRPSRRRRTTPRGVLRGTGEAYAKAATMTASHDGTDDPGGVDAEKDQAEPSKRRPGRSDAAYGASRRRRLHLRREPWVPSARALAAPSGRERCSRSDSDIAASTAVSGWCAAGTMTFISSMTSRAIRRLPGLGISSRGRINRETPGEGRVIASSANWQVLHFPTRIRDCRSSARSASRQPCSGSSRVGWTSFAALTRPSTRTRPGVAARDWRPSAS